MALMILEVIMAFSTALWQAISGQPWPYQNDPYTGSTQSNRGSLLGDGIVQPGEIGDTGNSPGSDLGRFLAITFTGKDPVTGISRQDLQSKHGIKTFGELVQKYPTPKPGVPRVAPPPKNVTGLKPMDVVMGATENKPPPVIQMKVGTTTVKPPVPKEYQPPPVVQMKMRQRQEITSDDIDKMLMKVHGINLDRYPNEARWMLGVLKDRLQKLEPRERGFLRDPFIPEDQKIGFLKGLVDWSQPEMHMERWMRRKLDEAINLGKGIAREVHQRRPVRPIEASGVFSPFGDLDEDDMNRALPESYGRSVASPLI